MRRERGETGNRLDVMFEGCPIDEAVLAGNHELGVGGHEAFGEHLRW